MQFESRPHPNGSCRRKGSAQAWSTRRFPHASRLPTSRGRCTGAEAAEQQDTTKAEEALRMPNYMHGLNHSASAELITQNT